MATLDWSKSTPSESMKVIYLALEREFLTPQQAMDCCLAMGASQQAEQPFDAATYISSQGWLALPQLQELEQLISLGVHPSLETMDEQVALMTIHETMVEIDADWAQKTSGLDTPVGTTLELDDESSQSRQGTDGTLAAPAFQGAKIHTIQEHSLLDLPSGEFFPSAGKRYEEGGELGRGGLGIVIEALDVRLGRKVARKSLLRGKSATLQEVYSFINEARVTGQLEHPNIIPIYDISDAADGDLFYTMRLMPSNNLEQALARQELSLMQSVKVLQQVCMGLEYAHSRGVVHRDIKPANILLGQFGEVLILDWGIAKVFGSDALEDLKTPALNTQKLRGTPAYMAPELIREGRVSPSIDQYALGVILYEILTGRLPFFLDNLYTLLFQICMDPPVPPRERSPHREIPEELEQICLKMLAKSPKERFASCREVHEQLEEFLEGTRERSRRHDAATARNTEANQLAAEYHLCRKQELILREDWEAAKKQIEPWEGLEKKRPVWEKENYYKEMQERSVTLFGAALQKFTQALEHEPGNAEARKGLAYLYWSKFEEAELTHDELGMIQYRDLVKFYDDGGHARLLEGSGTLELETYPSGAEVEIYRYVERDRRLVPVFVRNVGTTPLKMPLEMGSHLLMLRKEGYRDVSYPVMIKRCQELSAGVRLYTNAEIGKNFVYIPSGTFGFGGDVEARMSLPYQELQLDDFFISQSPITFGEYLAFLNDPEAHTPEQRSEKVPRSGQEAYAVLNEKGLYIPNREALFHGPIAERYPANEGHEQRVPVFGITWQEAKEYCQWRSQREGRDITLPTEQEWEKAASGADRRVFPWGHHFEANFCKMGRSRPPAELQPEPVYTFPEDCSPYGMCDVVGTISEMVVAADTPPEAEEIFMRGGGWIASSESQLRIGMRSPKQGVPRSYNSGFRIVCHPPKG